MRPVISIYLSGGIVSLINTLDSGINIGHGKFDKKNKHRGLNNWKIWQKFEVLFIEKKTRKSFFRFFILNLINERPFNKAVGPGKKIKNNKLRAYVYSGV